MIPNFCLDSQPSGIPLILHGLHFGFQPIEAPSIVSQFFFLTHVLHTSLSLSLSLSLFLFFPFPLILQIWLQEKLRFLLPPTVPLNIYLPSLLRDQLRDVLGFEAYIELLGRLMETDI